MGDNHKSYAVVDIKFSPIDDKENYSLAVAAKDGLVYIFDVSRTNLVHYMNIVRTG